MLAITGFEKTSLSDYPGKIAIIGFVGKTTHEDVGCNMNCPFCHNKGLWHKDAPGDEDVEHDFLRRISQTKSFVDAVVISGGEPTLLGADALIALSKKIRAINPKFSLKLDTNGLNPDVVNELIRNQAFDYYAMDIKGSFVTYPARTGLPQKNIDLEKIIRSIDLLTGSGVDYEFRTTVIPALSHSGIDVSKMKKEISEMITDFNLVAKISKGNLVLQNYNPVEGYLGTSLAPKEFKELVAEITKDYPFVVSRQDYSAHFIARKKNNDLEFEY